MSKREAYQRYNEAKYPLKFLERERLKALLCVRLQTLNSLERAYGYRPITPAQENIDLKNALTNSAHALSGEPENYSIFEAPAESASLNIPYPEGNPDSRFTNVLTFKHVRHPLGGQRYKFDVYKPYVKPDNHLDDSGYSWLIETVNIGDRVLRAKPYLWPHFSLAVSYPFFPIDDADFEGGSLNGHYTDLFKDLRVVVQAFRNEIKNKSQQ